MAMLVGFHTEGWDHLILCAFLARLLGLNEADIDADRIDAQGRGGDFVLDMVPSALQRFYGQCAQFAVVGLDNDGNIDLDRRGLVEDPKRPRHWLHIDQSNDLCRYCQLSARVEQTRPRLNYVPRKPGTDWPVLIVVAVEAIEAWLIASRALVHGPPHGLRAENLAHGRLKQEFYGRPVATREDVERVAIPLIREMTAEHLTALREYSQSFASFADQVEQCRQMIHGHRDCWSDGDRAAEHQQRA